MREPEDSFVGKQLQHYNIVEKIGAGGMGDVYLAHDNKLSRNVALKVLPSKLAANKDRLWRFDREAKVVAAMSHPGIVTIFSVEEADGVNFITMELIQGRNLSKLILSEGMSVERFLSLAIPITDAISTAHRYGIVHRDLKPDNIMITQDDRIKILDFGLAKLKPQAETKDLVETQSVFLAGSVTEQGVILGTVSFMSPEQAEGKEVDVRSDIFSLGVIFYQMLTGRLPFQGTSPLSIISSILRDTPGSVSEVNPAVPLEIAKIIRRCLQKDLNRRYQTVLDIKNDLQDFADEHKSSVRVPARRVPLWSAAVALGVLLALGGMFFLRNNRETSTQLGALTFTQLTEGAGQELFPSIAPDAKTFVYASRDSGNWDIYLQRITGENAISLTKDSEADDTQPAFSPDGNHIVFRSEGDGGGLFVMGATGESVLKISETGYNPAWFPDGKRVVFATENISQPTRRPVVSELWSVEIPAGKKQRIFNGDAVQPSVSPGGERIAFWAQAKESSQIDIFTISPRGGEPVAVTNDAAIDWNPVWSPDGKFIYFSSDRSGSMNIWRIAIDEKTGEVVGSPEAFTTGAAAECQHLSLSQDGRHILYAARVETKNILKAGFDPVNKVQGGESNWLTQRSRILAWPNASPDNKWIAFTTEGKQEDLFIVHPDGTGLRQLTNDIYKDRAPHWSPHGNQIAFFSGRSGKYEIWSIKPDGSDLKQITKFPGAHYPVWSPDGKRMAFSHHNPNGNFIFQPFSGNNQPLALPPLPDPTQTFEAWSWSFDGKELAGIRHLQNGDHVGIIVYSFETRRLEPLTDFGEWPVWLRDNRSILFFSKDKIYVVDRNSKQTRTIPFATSQQIVGAFAVSPDERTLYLPIDTTQADLWMITLGS